MRRAAAIVVGFGAFTLWLGVGVWFGFVLECPPGEDECFPLLVPAIALLFAPFVALLAGIAISHALRALTRRRDEDGTEKST